MTQEEKARAYDKALESAIIAYKDEDRHLKATLERIFPELKVSEDERINKEIIKYLEQTVPHNHRDEVLKSKEWIAWLEKQGEQEQLYIRFGEIPTDEKSKIFRGEIEVGTENGVSVYPAFKTNEGDIVLGLNLPITKTTLYTQQHLIEYDDRPCYLVKGDYVGKDTDGQPLINNISIIEKIDNYRIKDEKQVKLKPIVEMITPEESLGISSEEYNEIVNECLYGKPKSADNDEPKFKIKEGKWYICTQTFVLRGNEVIIKGKTYQAEKDNVIKGENGCRFIDMHDGKASDYLKSWTIQDAKDGDVLFHSDSASNGIFIFKELLKYEFSEKVICYCDYDSEDHFCLGEHHTCCWADAKILHPATKEQRDTLFAKIKEAGYEWDAEKKELKKIEHKWHRKIY